MPPCHVFPTSPLAFQMRQKYLVKNKAQLCWSPLPSMHSTQRWTQGKGPLADDQVTVLPPVLWNEGTCL
jgi:hypothetical protein